VCSKKPSWFDSQWFDNSCEKNQEGLVQTSQKIKCVQKNLLGLIVGLIIQVKKTKKVLIQTSQKIKCVQKTFLVWWSTV
jgi:hypothetical protein